MNYTVGIITIQDLMDDIKRALDAKALFSALALSFALVDECAKICYNNICISDCQSEKDCLNE